MINQGTYTEQIACRRDHEQQSHSPVQLSPVKGYGHTMMYLRRRPTLAGTEDISSSSPLPPNLPHQRTDG